MRLTQNKMKVSGKDLKKIDHVLADTVKLIANEIDLIEQKPYFITKKILSAKDQMEQQKHILFTNGRQLKIQYT